MKIVHIVGARPNFVKAAPLFAAFERYGVAQTLVHSGQHYDDNMSGVFFREFGLPQPDISLNVGSGSHAEQTAAVMVAFEKVVVELQPDWVMTYGDVNTTLAASLVSAKLNRRVAHVEAGLRSFDWTMPEEINRVVTDRISDLLFTPSEDGNENLRREGVSESKIHLVGNIMIDSLAKFFPLTSQHDRTRYPEKYALVTLHRPSNVDNEKVLGAIMPSLARISNKLPVVFPVHPRTRKLLSALNGWENTGDVRLIDPTGYLEFLGLEKHATVVITDSGGIQEETTYLGIPCLTLRENTERPVTVSLGTNQLIGSDVARLEREVDRILCGEGKKGTIPPLWDGKTADRIARVVLEM